ncbi:unnamed protein product [Amoebophrya sp. A120]|nr:unnamed protein product [Amoebophrya sp. A120]|eukprot:GSA120T00025780001.1
MLESSVSGRGPSSSARSMLLLPSLAIQVVALAFFIFHDTALSGVKGVRVRSSASHSRPASSSAGAQTHGPGDSRVHRDVEVAKRLGHDLALCFSTVQTPGPEKQETKRTSRALEKFNRMTFQSGEVEDKAETMRGELLEKLTRERRVGWASAKKLKGLRDNLRDMGEIIGKANAKDTGRGAPPPPRKEKLRFLKVFSELVATALDASELRLAAPEEFDSIVDGVMLAWIDAAAGEVACRTAEGSPELSSHWERPPYVFIQSATETAVEYTLNARLQQFARRARKRGVPATFLEDLRKSDLVRGVLVRANGNGGEPEVNYMGHNFGERVESMPTALRGVIDGSALPPFLVTRYPPLDDPSVQPRRLKIHALIRYEPAFFRFLYHPKVLTLVSEMPPRERIADTFVSGLEGEYLAVELFGRQ